MEQTTIFNYTDPKKLFQERERTGKNSSQRDRIIQLLSDGALHSPGEFLKMGIAQYNARVYELRKKGHKITNYNIEGDTYFFLEEENGEHI